MPSQVTFGFVSSFVACSFLSVVAAAQEAAPSPAVPAQAPPFVSNTAPADPPATSMPLAVEPRADVVERSWPNRPLLITGGVLLGGTYAASVIVGAASDREADEKLFYPVVGPWLDLKERDCGVNDCGNDTLNKALLIGSGALQGIGAVTLLLGLVIPESREKPWYLIGDEDVVVGPQIGLQLTGFTASGRF